MFRHLLISAFAGLALTACDSGTGPEETPDQSDEAAEEMANGGQTEDSAGTAADTAADPISAAVHENDARTEEQMARDAHRHPEETLRFFGVEPDMTLIELHPGGGWYTAILAPLVREEGQYIGIEYAPETFENERYRTLMQEFPEKVANNPELYGENAKAGYILDDQIAPDNSVDMVLGIRFMHNWIRNGFADEALDNVYAALKPGGVFGVVQHRAPEDSDKSTEELAQTGYVKESALIEMAEAHGFELAEKAEINANPKDTADHPRGVWTLPPSLALGDEDKEKYQEIGESDRMTLKFVKPEA